MLYAGLDLSRKRLDFHLLDAEGATVEVGAAPPDADGLRGLSERLARHGEPVRAAIESMNGARFVHDRLELAGWRVEIADAQKVKGLAPLACKTDRIDAWVLAELARRDLVPAIWLPDPLVRAERERARWRLHLVRHRSSLKQRVHAVLLTHGKPLPRLRSVRRPRPSAARPARAARALARNARGQPAADRRARPRDHSLRARAAPRRRAPLRPPALHRARNQLGARLHNRRRARRHQPLRLTAVTRRLQRPLPARLPIRRPRPARPARQAGPGLSPLGAGRGRHHACTAPAYRDRYHVGFANSGGLVFVDESAEEVATVETRGRVQRRWVAAVGREQA
jgi:hypothetical protein